MHSFEQLLLSWSKYRFDKDCNLNVFVRVRLIFFGNNFSTFSHFTALLNFTQGQVHHGFVLSTVAINKIIFITKPLNTNELKFFISLYHSQGLRDWNLLFPKFFSSRLFFRQEQFSFQFKLRIDFDLDTF